ncbi:MAG: hypothetical protein IPK19_29975 [Chloroflexi bacterium]|nr:hypothetical protein [Chloroflexota bacterium]
MAQDSKPKKYEDLLMAALRFDESDLAANMAGAWSERQSAQLLQRQRDHVVWAVILGILAFVFTFFLVRVSGSVGLALNGLAALSFMAGLIAVAVSRSRITKDLQSNLREVEGRVRLDTRSSNNKTTYFLRIDDVRFKVSKKEFLTFKNHDPYRIYYAPNQKKILSAEWLRGDSGSIDESPQATWSRTSELELPADEADGGDVVLGDVVLGDDGELIERKAKPGR